MAYIQIIILTILGPLQLMMNALPGSDAFSKWFRNLLANALAFPAAALMLVFAAALTSQSGELWDISPDIGFARQGEGVKWIPPLIFGEGGSFSTTDPVTSVLALFGIGVLLMTPKVVDMVKEWVQAPEFKYGSAIGEAVGFGWQKTGGFAINYAAQREADERQILNSFYLKHGHYPNRSDPGEMTELQEMMKGAKFPRGWQIPADILKKQIMGK